MQDRLEQDWSPQQIAAWLRVTHPDRPSWQVCPETIYQALYRGRLSRELLAPALLIDARPPQVQARQRIGDWKGDLIVGRMSQSAIGTLVERTSLYLRLIHLPDGHRADQVVQVSRWDRLKDMPGVGLLVSRSGIGDDISQDGLRIISSRAGLAARHQKDW